MKLIYSDSHSVDPLTFRRLILLGSNITFVNRPSIRIEKDYGTIETPSNVTGVLNKFQNGPVKLYVETPPTSVFSSEFYHSYFRKDLQNSLFIGTVVKGIRQNWIGSNFFDPKNDHVDIFKDFKTWILQNWETINSDELSLATSFKDGFKILDRSDAIFAFKMILFEESLRVTAVLHMSDKKGCNPISVSPFLNTLISLRLSEESYTGRRTQNKHLGIRLFESLIPDEALKKIQFDDLLAFREKTRDYYEAWEIEINRLESELASNGFKFTDKEVNELIEKEINPKVFGLKTEIKKIRDERFKDVMKSLRNFGVSLITSGTLISINVPVAIAGFILTNMKTPKLTDDIIEANFKIKGLKESNGLTYIMELNKLIGE